MDKIKSISKIIDDICKKHNLSDDIKKEIIELSKISYVAGSDAVWQILTEPFKKDNSKSVN